MSHDYAQARANMVEHQLRPNKVTDPAVLRAFGEVPREAYVPQALRGVAYIDEDLPLGRRRFLMDPAVLARLVQEARVARGDRVLVIGCGSGYSAAILASLAGSVVAVESDAELAAAARDQLGGSSKLRLLEGPLDRGCAESGPYEVILVDGAVAAVPHGLYAQLAEGGRLVVVIRPPQGVGEGVLIERIGGALSRRALFDAAIPPLPGFAAEPAFSF